MIHKLERYLPYIFLLTLILWGIYATIMFLGVDGHIVVLLKNDVWQEIAQNARHPFLRGLNGLIPFFGNLAERLRPLLAYGVVSMLLYGAFVVYTILKHGKLYIDNRVSALHVMLLFFGSAWLIFTTLFYAPLPGLQPQLTLEPIKEALSESVSNESLIVLEENFDRLQKGGCLREDPDGRRTQAGAKAYWYRGSCVQKAFVTRVLSQAGMLLLFILNFLVIGRLFLKLLGLKVSKLMEFAMSLGVGAAGLTLLLWFFALFKSLSTAIAWGSVVVIPLLGYKNTIYWLRSLVETKWRFKASFGSFYTLIFWLLISYLAFNFITVVRPFPIGWDDLGRYINGARQVSVFGHIIPGMLAAQWEYLTSLGFLLFGYYSSFGATLAQQINWMAGLFAALAVFVCAKVVLGKGRGLLAALFYYTLPMVGHFSFADMKTENALMFYGALGLTAVLVWVGGREGAEGTEVRKGNGNMKWLFIAGLLFAAGIATKPTIVMLFLAAGVILTFDMLGIVSGIGSMFLSTLVLTKANALRLPKIAEKLGIAEISSFETTVTLILFIIGIVLLFYPLLYSIKKTAGKKKRIKEQKTYWTAVTVLIAGLLAFSAPWMTRNVIENGGKPIPATMLGAPNRITPSIAFSPEDIPVDAPKGSRSLPAELAIDPDHEQCIGTSEEEELDRYWGYRTGMNHFLGLPWRVVMNSDSQGYYLTTSPLLLMLPLLLLLPFFWRNRLLRLVFWGTTIYVVQWIFAASGIPWYGIGMFLGFAICVEALVAFAPDRISKSLAGVLCAVALCIVFSLRMWQFSMQMNLHEYSWGKASHEVLREMTIPDYDDITESVVELSKNQEYPYLYRMGTFISYFIPRNREIIPLNDNQLGFFNCLNQERDHKLTLQRLRALGFHSIVFDTNTATIEKDPAGTLHQKVNRFLEFANDPELGIVSVINNPGGGVAYMILPEEAPSSALSD